MSAATFTLKLLLFNYHTNCNKHSHFIFSKKTSYGCIIYIYSLFSINYEEIRTKYQ